jgi:hypothetical protein
MSRLSESNGLAAAASDKELKQVKEITNLGCGESSQWRRVEAKHDDARKGMSSRRSLHKQARGWNERQ